MIKKFDVYIKDGKALIYPRADIPECADLPYNVKPLHEMNEDEDWWEWCDSQNDPHEALCCNDIVRECRAVCTFPAHFKDDLLKKAQKLFDEYRKGGEFLGWGKCEIDRSYTRSYRRSAAWKDEPTYYTFDQPLKWTDKDTNITYTGEALRVRDNLVQLWGMSDALYELGLNLVFTKDFKLHIFGGETEWKAEIK